MDLVEILERPEGKTLEFKRDLFSPDGALKTIVAFANTSGGTLKHFTLKTKRMTRADLDEFVACYRPGDRNQRQATWSEATPDGRWRPYAHDEILARDKVSLDLFWLRDESLEDSASLPEPHLLAQEIADDLRSALAQIEDVLGDLEQRVDAGASEEA
ncbi:MAG: ATP-binding protein [bacterium]|nr:ATP-binding protein [bacterium]